MVASGGCRYAWPGDLVDFQGTIQLLARPFGVALLIFLVVLCVFVCSCLGLAGLSAFHRVVVSAHRLPLKASCLCGEDLGFRCIHVVCAAMPLRVC